MWFERGVAPPAGGQLTPALCWSESSWCSPARHQPSCSGLWCNPGTSPQSPPTCSSGPPEAQCGCGTLRVTGEHLKHTDPGVLMCADGAAVVQKLRKNLQFLPQRFSLKRKSQISRLLVFKLYHKIFTFSHYNPKNLYWSKKWPIKITHHELPKNRVEDIT